MPWTIQVDPAHRVSYMRLSSVVTCDDLRAAQIALGRDPQFQPTFPFLVDLTGASEIRVTWQELMVLTEASPVAPSIRRAILVGGVGVLGVVRVYESLRESKTSEDTLRVCHTLTEAAEWLGVQHLKV